MITSPQELGDWLRLTLTPDIGARTRRRLLAAWASPRQIFEQDERTLGQWVQPRQARALRTEPEGWAALHEQTWQWLHAPRPDTALAHAPRAIVTLGDADYPAPLLEMPDPPLMLYALGQVTALSRLDIASSLSIVGSRNPTPQGHAHAHAFARSLAARGLTVVSGMALGVDGAAHEGALEGSTDPALATVAVVGTGLDRVYPRQHLALAQHIAERGLILSEYPLGTPPLRANFPQRNRIISGLAQGTLVVEAALQSGSLITAREALEQGREVFAIPGSIHSPLSRGCHALIREGAKLVESAQDVLEELRQPQLFSARDVASSSAQAMLVDENALLRALGHDPVSLDALQARCGLDTASLQAQLLELELAGQVARLASGLFQRVGQA
jgi:DNA processing protein